MDKIEAHKCQHKGCTRRIGDEDLHQLNSEQVNISVYADTAKAQLALKANMGKWRCKPCFKLFLERNKLRAFLYLLER